MLLDRNKTERTHDITRAVISWLRERGFKPIETEVLLRQGWQADVAGVCVPTETEAIRLKLVERKPKFSWPAGHYQLHQSEEERARNIALYQEWEQSIYQPWKATMDALPTPLTALCEVKQSRADYFRDKKFTEELPPANLCFLALPHALLKPSELPPRWFILESVGRDVRLTRKGEMFPVQIEQQLLSVLALAMRRDNSERYATAREEQMAQRAESAKRETVARYADVTRAILRVVRGERTTEEALAFSRVKLSENHPLREDLKKLEGVALGLNRLELTPH
ncbi:MAG TPA: hypothetical protein VF543_22540 [Pyrinomonadaceae bacterium]|jgi:hypothetical protein